MRSYVGVILSAFYATGCVEPNPCLRGDWGSELWVEGPEEGVAEVVDVEGVPMVNVAWAFWGAQLGTRVRLTLAFGSPVDEFAFSEQVISRGSCSDNGSWGSSGLMEYPGVLPIPEGARGELIFDARVVELEPVWGPLNVERFTFVEAP